MQKDVSALVQEVFRNQLEWLNKSYLSLLQGFERLSKC